MYDATRGHYGADVAPWLALATLYGLSYLRQGVGRWRPRARGWVIVGASLLLLLVAVVWHLFRGYSPLALDPPHWEITEHDRLARHFIAQIPPEASLSAQGKLYPHLSNRIIVYQLPVVNDAEYVFVDVSPPNLLHPYDLRTVVQDILRSGEFGVLDAADGYLLLRRGLNPSTLPDAFYDFVRAPFAQPQYPLNVEFGDELRLLGFDLVDDARRQETSIRLYWQALRSIDHDLRLYPFFVNAKGEVIEDTNERPLITQLWYPPRQWQPGEIVVEGYSAARMPKSSATSPSWPINFKVGLLGLSV